MSITTEIVTFKTVEGIKRDEFIRIVDGLEINYHSRQPGFIDTELSYHEKGDEWIMIQHWESPEQMKSASAGMFHNSVTEEFVQSLDPKTVKMKILLQLGTWSS